MNKISIPYIIILAFACFGVMTFSIILHEHSHKQDFKGLVNEDSTCVLDFDKMAGYYTFSYNMSNLEEIKDIGKYTEWKAYGVTAIVLGLFGLVVALDRRIN